MTNRATPSETLDVQGVALRFASTWGTVAGSQKHAETRVYGSGGGSSYNGTASPVHIGSTVTVKQEFFLQHADGSPERAVQLSGADVPIRDGQTVTLVSGKKDGGDGYFWMRLVNHDAERAWNIASTDALLDDAGMWKEKKVRLVGGLIFIGIWIVLMAFSLGTVGLIAGAVAGFWFARKKRAERASARAAVDAHLGTIVDWALAERRDTMRAKQANLPNSSSTPRAATEAT